MATYPPQYIQPPVEETSYTAIFALIIAVVAIIILIVVIFFFSENQAIIKDVVGQWSVSQGVTTATATFTGNPNSIYQAPSTLTVAQTLTVAPYTNISSFVTSAATTVFKIDNTSGGNTITLTPTPASGGLASPGDVPKGAVYEYQWIPGTTVTTFKLIGWSKP